MRIPMTDLKAQHSSLRQEIAGAIERVTDSGRFILGPEVEEFEAEMAAYCGTRFAIGVASGTDALIIGLRACGIGPGDEVITTPFTFIATAMAVTHCGATPVFVDIDPQTFNIDPDQIEPHISLRTKAILPVHLFGQPAEMGAIVELAKKRRLRIVEDCAQALGAEYRGRKTGSIGDIGCFSFFPSKNLGAYGDGGMVATNDPDIAEAARMLRNHGARVTYHHTLNGFNSRLDAIQAAILRLKLKHLDNWSSLRRQKVLLYNRLLSDTQGVARPHVAEYNTTSANYYTVRLPDRRIDRDGLRRHLASKGIETNVYYPLSLHLQEVYRCLGHRKGDFPHSEAAQEEVLSLPLFPEITDDDVTEVVTTINEFCRGIEKRTGLPGHSSEHAARV